MAKLGYTWYPKDWGNSEAVFELNLIQRGLYRELIDLAMLNDNKTVLNLDVWSRKWNIEKLELIAILTSLESFNLIKIINNNLFIESCEARLNMVRGGSEGGKKSKPINKGSKKPISKGTPKGDSNQKKLKEKEIKEKINENLLEPLHSVFNKWLEYRKEINKPINVKSTLDGLIKRFNKEGKYVCEHIVEASIENNYQGLFWENAKIESKTVKPKFNSPIL